MSKKNTCLLLFILIFISSTLFSLGGFAQRLDKFVAESNRIGDARFPYNKVVTYFGYIDSITEPYTFFENKKNYFLYFELMDSVPEVGIRMISPVPHVVMPDKGDLVSENYYLFEKDKTNYFDPWIALESVENLKSISPNDTTTKWFQLSSNDDSSELFSQPTGKRLNALLRFLTPADTSAKKIPPGIYRIRFTDIKHPEIKGSFVVQLGATVKQAGLKLVRTPEELLR